MNSSLDIFNDFKCDLIAEITTIVIVLQLDVQLSVQSMPITTQVVSLNVAQVRCSRYNIML